MPVADDPAQASAAGRVSQLIRHHGPDAPVVEQARHQLRVAQTVAAVRRAVESAPPLTPEQIDRLRALLPVPSTPDSGEAA